MSPHLKDLVRALWGKGKPEENQEPASPVSMPVEALDGNWSDFEGWIRSAIGGEFTWKARPCDTEENRVMVMEAIAESTQRNGGVFPKRNAFLERLEQ